MSLIPPRVHLHGGSAKSTAFSKNIADAIKNAGFREPIGCVLPGTAMRTLIVNPEIAMRRDHLLDQPDNVMRRTAHR